MNELRLLFDRAAEGGYSVRLENNWGGAAGQAVAFTPFLEEDDFEDLRWYLEDYMDLPDGGAVVRAQRIEHALDAWGRRLYDAVFGPAPNRELLAALQQAAGARTLTIATGELAVLRLPWELLADSAGALGLQGLSVRRQLPDAVQARHRQTRLPLRILLVVSRPGELGFIDPRLTSASLLDAVQPLGDEVQVDFVRPPTLVRLQEMLAAAGDDPYQIVHFEGHGTFLPDVEIGALCFEQPDTAASALAESQTDYVRADRLGQILAAHRVPLVILEACRSGTLGKLAVFRAVAPRLIEAGVGSVISMGHAVHVEAARILLERFYRELVQGVTVGQALDQGRAALLAQPARWLELGPGARTVELRDFFLPHLYQRGDDQPILPPAAPPPDRFDVFLSHQDADSERVTRIALQLKTRHGLRVWLDKWEMRPGGLRQQCVDGVRRSRFVLIACTQAALESKWVQAEQSWACADDPTGNNVIPLLLDDVGLPPDLKSLLWLDFRDPNRDAEQAAEVARLVGPPLDGGGRRPANRAPALAGQTGAFPRPPRYGFQGRARELYDLERQFRRYRAILLHAMGGMGKTTLATEGGQWWTRTGLFPDGACFVSFEQFTSADRVVQVLGEYLEGVGFNSLPIDEQHRRARELFQQKRVLLVWDNFESVLPSFNRDPTGSASGPDQAPGQGVRDALADALPVGSRLNEGAYTDDERARLVELFRDLTDAPGGAGRLLITCRPLRTAGDLLPTARPIELHGLARHDALGLLVRVLEQSGVDPDEKELTRQRLDPLLKLLADHPLSIELVGPHLARLTPEEVCQDFARLLAEFKVGAGQERNESLLASLAFSTRRLSPAAQQVLPWLGLFSGGVFEQVLLDVIGDGDEESGTDCQSVQPMRPQADERTDCQSVLPWDAIRAELESTALIRVEREILLADRPYLRFHPTLPYAAASRSVPDPAAARKRFIEVYDAVDTAVGQALRGSNPRGGLEVLAREEPNFRTAVRWAAEDQQYAVASAMGDTFREYLQRTGRLRERDAWVTWLAGEVRKGGFSKALAARERDEAWTLFTQGQGREALRRLEDLIERLRATQDFDPAFQLATTRLMLGRVLLHSGLSEQAIPQLQAAVGQWEALVDAALSLGETESGSRSELATMGAATERGNLAATLGDLANALTSAGRLDEALAAANRGLDIYRELGQDRGVAADLGRCAQILMQQGRHAEADPQYDAAIAAARRAGDKELEGLFLQHQGILARRLEQYPRAASLYQRALKLFQEMNNEGSIMRTCNLMGVIEQRQRRLPEARSWYQRSREIAQRLGDIPCLAQAAQNIGIVCQEEGEAARQQGREPEARQRFEEAKGSIREAVRLMRQLGNQPYEAMSLSQLAHVHLLLGELDEAERNGKECLAIDERLGIVRELASDYGIMATIARARGDAAQAAEWDRKRDAVRQELQRRSRGSGGLPPQFFTAVQQLAIACAQASVDGGELAPDVESALAQLDELPAPLSDLSAFLRATAAGQFPLVPTALPPELAQFLTQLQSAVREARSTA